MITAAEVTRAAEAQGVPAHVVERDYAISHALSRIFGSDRSTGLVFKGGTALRACYFENFRFSADLDFSLREGADRSGAIEALSGALEARPDDTGPRLLTLDDESRIRYVGPLGKERAIKLDIAGDELVLETQEMQLLARYEDLVAVSLPVYTLTEITAEKLRCLLQRMLCRDLFDLDYIAATGLVELGEAWLAFEKKAEHKGRRADELPQRLGVIEPRLRARWLDELHDFLSEPPDYDAVMRRVRRFLRPRLR